MKQRIRYFFILLLSIIFIGVSPVLTRADSGWDVDYDTGGDSWDSGDYDGYDGSGGGSLTFGQLMLLLGFLVFMGIICQMLGKKYNGSVDVSGDKSVDDEKLKTFGIDKEELIDEFYNKYVDVQDAWMNFDYDKMKMLVTDELFNTYSSQLKVLKLKKQKNIMSNIEFVSGRITDVKDTNGIRSVSVIMKVNQFDYVVDEENKVIRGDDNHKLSVTYKLTFVSSVDNEEIVVCPNCGAKNKIVVGGNCEYCQSKIVVPPKNYVLSKKTVISQK